SLAMHNFHDTYQCFPWGRSKGALDSPTWAVILLPYIEQQGLWNRFTDPNINGTNFNMITRPESAASNPRFTTHNLIRGRFRDTGAMKASVPLFVCPSRRGTATVSETLTIGSSSSEGICGDYGINYGSGTSTAEANNGVARWQITGDVVGVRVADITDGTSNTFLLGEKHVRPTDFGNAAQGDFCIYNSQQWYWSGRKAGTAF